MASVAVRRLQPVSNSFYPPYVLGGERRYWRHLDESQRELYRERAIILANHEHTPQNLAEVDEFWSTDQCFMAHRP